LQTFKHKKVQSAFYLIGICGQISNILIEQSMNANCHMKKCYTIMS